MKTRLRCNVAWAALLAALMFSHGCGDDGPAPTPDGAPEQPDGAPDQPDAAPDPDAPPMPDLVLVGTVSVGDTTVEARTNDALIGTTTSDANGLYRLELGYAGPDVLHLVAHDGGTIRLASVLADMTRLSARAGADGELTTDEFDAVDITPVSTVRHAAVRAGHGGALVTTEQELVDAEQLMTGAATGSQLLDMAATVQLIITSPDHDLPAWAADTLALAEDLPRLRTHMDGIRSSSPDDVIASTRATMMSEPLMTAEFSAAGLPSAYRMDWIKHNNGFIGSGGDTLELDPGGAGRYHTSDTSRLLLAPFQVGWTVQDSASGTRLVTARQPTGERTGTTQMTAEQLAGLFPGDPALQDEIRAAVGAAFVPVEVEHIGADRTLVASGLAVDLVWTSIRWHYRVSGPLAGYGVTAADVDASLPPVGSLMFREEAIAVTPMDPADMLGTWAMQVVAPADDDSFIGSFVAGDRLLAHALVTFANDGTASATRGVLDAPMSLTWQIDADGNLVLDYPDGAQQLVRLWARVGPEYGFLSDYTSPGPGEERIIYYWRAIKTDPGFVLTGTELPNQVDQYWKTTINIASYYPDENGAFTLNGEFGFRFFADGQVDSIHVNTFEDMPPELVIVDVYVWRVDAGDVVINWWRSETQAQCGPANSECYALRERTWVPLAQEGPLLYVLEDYRVQADYPLLQWDPVDLRWELNGQPADLNAREYIFPPRVNAYFVAPIPSL